MSASASIDLSAWVEKIKSSKTRSELFATLDKFRVLEWTDEQRSSIAKLYMRLLDVLPQESDSDDSSSKSGGPAKPAEQEEVWYEKM